VFELGVVGLNVIHGLRLVGADNIIGSHVNPERSTR
jgi:Zn-dependent alcohol dehydrogenase